jgi:hypothetical protein
VIFLDQTEYAGGAGFDGWGLLTAIFNDPLMGHVHQATEKHPWIGDGLTAGEKGLAAGIHQDLGRHFAPGVPPHAIRQGQQNRIWRLHEQATVLVALAVTQQ